MKLFPNLTHHHLITYTNLTPVSNVCETVPRSLFWALMGSTNYWKLISNFPSTWLANQQWLLELANHGVYLDPGIQVGTNPFPRGTFRKFQWEQKWILQGKKLFHFIVNPGTAPSWLPNETTRWLPSWKQFIETGIKDEKCVNGTRNPIRKFRPGKWAYLFRLSTFSGNFPGGRTDKMFSIFYRA